MTKVTNENKLPYTHVRGEVYIETSPSSPDDYSTPQKRRAALDVALLDMADEGRRPTCSTDPERWISDDRAERGAAARECAGCPVIEPCAASGADEPFGIWGGIDRTPRPGRRPALTENTTTRGSN